MLFFNDAAGRGNLRSNKVYGSVAYHQMIGLSSLLSAGFNAGYASKRIDVTKFTFDNQWNGKFFDAGAPNGEAKLTNPSSSYFDLQVGMNYAYFTMLLAMEVLLCLAVLITVGAMQQ